MEINNLNHNPTLRELLINYVLRMYEEASILDDEHLLMEYRLLLRENRLNDLFMEERLINYWKYGNEFKR
jgi:hypothetical protein